MRMCFTLKLLQQFASKAAYRPNSTGHWDQFLVTSS